jgi:SAM-dependent methyltransferase
MTTDSLDYAFLKHFGVTAEGEVQIHSIYLPYFADYHRVLELGSGMGGFVKMLLDEGKDAYGVDSDPGCIASARALPIPVVEADVIDYLRTVEPESLDAIFSSHLVEHLPHHVVLEVIQLSYRALRPGGRLMLVTPNHKALFSHLDMYHLHFGHVAFYPTDLLAFFMTHCGFAHTQMGDNPLTAPQHMRPNSPWSELQRHLVEDPLPPPPDLRPSVLLPRPRNPVRRLIWTMKMGLLHWLVQPFTDRLADYNLHLYEQSRRNQQAVKQLAHLVEQPFESFVIGDKAAE